MLDSFDIPLEFVLRDLMVQQTLGNYDNDCKVCDLILGLCAQCHLFRTLMKNLHKLTESADSALTWW